MRSTETSLADLGTCQILGPPWHSINGWIMAMLWRILHQVSLTRVSCLLGPATWKCLVG